MRVAYIYAGFSLGLAAFLLYLTLAGLRTPGWGQLDMLTALAAVFLAFTLVVAYLLREQGTGGGAPRRASPSARSRP